MYPPLIDDRVALRRSDHDLAAGDHGVERADPVAPYGSAQRKSQFGAVFSVNIRSIELGSIVKLEPTSRSKVRPIPFVCWTLSTELPLRLIDRRPRRRRAS